MNKYLLLFFESHDYSWWCVGFFCLFGLVWLSLVGFFLLMAKLRLSFCNIRDQGLPWWSKPHCFKHTVNLKLNFFDFFPKELTTFLRTL